MDEKEEICIQNRRNVLCIFWALNSCLPYDNYKRNHIERAKYFMAATAIFIAEPWYHGSAIKTGKYFVAIFKFTNTSCFDSWWKFGHFCWNRILPKFSFMVKTYQNRILGRPLIKNILFHIHMSHCTQLCMCAIRHTDFLLKKCLQFFTHYSYLAFLVGLKMTYNINYRFFFYRFYFLKTSNFN